ncbi:Response regulator receiver modulated serine phosphatase [Candidatus Sulfopaludibacter sp. SbA3]|nr:Response regulator receiver modulated serine phosphatase [Candidatus Sulfopaludibacter sp. SbA3]
MPHQILVVDDEPDLELLVTQKLRRQIRDKQFEFFFGRNGEEALEILSHHPGIDLVLSDINMPVMDGLTLLGKLSGTSRTRKAVIVSAYGDMANIRTAMNRGAADFLMKPIDFADLEVTVHKILTEIAHLKEAAENQERLQLIERELTVAARIQQWMLPRDFPPFPGRSDFELHGAMTPAKEVGGDLFDFFLLDDDHLGVVIGDVSGKGVPAALFMAVTRTLLRGVALEGKSPGECLDYVNARLCSQSDSSMFVTLFYGILNTRTGEFRFASGGHNPPYLFKPGGHPRQLHGTGCLIVGCIPAAKYCTDGCILAPGEALLLYTDGVTEAMSNADEFFGEERLEKYLNEHVSTSAEQLVTNLLASLKTFAADAPQSDDITALVLRHTPPAVG